MLGRAGALRPLAIEQGLFDRMLDMMRFDTMNRLGKSRKSSLSTVPLPPNRIQPPVSGLSRDDALRPCLRPRLP